jgi:hypothetical protein
MLDDLKEALWIFNAEEGVIAKNTLVWDAVRNNQDRTVASVAQGLSDSIKEAQAQRGSHHPQCGDTLAAEILCWLGMLMAESKKEEK